MKNKKIFIVHDPDNSEPIEFFDAIFDSFEEAEAFTKRFKENSEFSITEKTVNPAYRTSKELSPYYVRFDRDEFEPKDASLSDFSLDDAEADSNDVFIDCEKGTNKLKQFEQWVYAARLEEAVAIVRKNRDDFLANRELENVNIKMIVS